MPTRKQVEPSQARGLERALPQWFLAELVDHGGLFRESGAACVDGLDGLFSFEDDAVAEARPPDFAQMLCCLKTTLPTTFGGKR